MSASDRNMSAVEKAHFDFWVVAVAALDQKELSGVGASPPFYFGNLMHWRSGVSWDADDNVSTQQCLDEPWKYSEVLTPKTALRPRNGRHDMIRWNRRLEHSRFTGILLSVMPMREIEDARKYYDLEVGILLWSFADFVERIFAMRTLLRFPLQQFLFYELLFSKGNYVSKIWWKDSLLLPRPVRSAENFLVTGPTYSIFYISYQHCWSGRWNRKPQLNQHCSTAPWASNTGCIFLYLHISQAKHRVYQLLSNRFSHMYSQLVEYW